MSSRRRKRVGKRESRARKNVTFRFTLYGLGGQSCLGECESSEMEESSDRNTSTSGLSSGGTNKMNSDSGYGSNKSNSNKSNSQSQRSSGSSKSHQSSMSSGSCGFPSHSSGNIATIQEQHGPVPSGPQPVPISSSAGSKCKSSEQKEHCKRKKKCKGKGNAGTGVVDGGLLRSGSQGEQGCSMGSPLPPPEQMSIVTGPLSASTPSGGEISQGSQQPSSPEERPEPMDSKTLQMAALNHALSCMKKFRDNALDLSDDCDEDKLDSSVFWKEQFDNMKEELNYTSDDVIKHCFGAVVSMEDGLVVHITEEIPQILGYPKDMWVGRSFMDLVHPKDKMSFASQFTFTSGLIFSQGDYNAPGRKGVKNGTDSFFCRLRQYRGLKTSGFGVADKPVVFFPFRLTLKFKEVENMSQLNTGKVGTTSEPGASVEATETSKPVYLFIGANRISSAYKYPEEVPANPLKFMTRHSASCQFGHMDPSAVSYLGHLPQDVIGHSVFDYYHPDDMELLKGIYEGVMTERGKPFKSKPYRFRVYNGTFAMLETDWSCFINPWSWKLEFVIGQHKVLKGPLNPNVFTPPKSVEGEDSGGENKQVKDQIKSLLGETVTHRDPLKQRSLRRKKDLVTLLETLLDQIGNNESSDMSESVASGAFSVLDRDSVMLGEISPHHDCHSSSNQSSETPPSYNQLNYRENIERFFQSRPKTTRESEECGETAGKNDMDIPLSTDEDSKGSPIDSSGSGNMYKKIQCGSNEDGQNSGNNGGRKSGNHSGSGNSAVDAAKDDDNCVLTEDVLWRHNEYMEKFMVQKHRESRGKNSLASASNKNSRAQRHQEQGQNQCRERQNHLKRSGIIAGCASSGSSRKAHKQPHLDHPSSSSNTYGERSSAAMINQRIMPAPVNLWPPYSVGLAQPSVTSTFTRANTGVPMTGGPIPNVQYMTAGQPIGMPRTQPIQLGTQNPAYLCFPNQLQQFAPQQVPFTVGNPGSVMYNSLGTGPTSAFSPTAANLFTAGRAHGLQQPQQYLMTPAGPPMMGQLMHPAGRQMLPNVPGSVGQPMGMNYGMGPRVQMRPVIPGSAGGMNHQPVRNMMPGMSHGQAKVRPPVSVATSTSSSSSLFSMASSTQPSVSEASPSGISIPSSSSNDQRRQQAKEHHHHHHHHHHHAPSPKKGHEAPKERVHKDAPPYPKAPADFSSSDAFGDSSSSSLYSFLKHGRSSDDCSNSPSGSREEKEDSGDRIEGQWGADCQNWDDIRGKMGGGDENGKYRKRTPPRVPKKPHWLQDVGMTPELSMRYEVPTGNMEEILQRDMQRMERFGQQSTLVNEQLEKLCAELELDENPDLNLEDGSSRYNSSYGSGNGSSNDDDFEDEDSKGSNIGENDTSQDTEERKARRKPVGGKKKKVISPWIYDKIVHVYEENAPFPADPKKKVQDTQESSG